MPFAVRLVTDRYPTRPMASDGVRLLCWLEIHRRLLAILGIESLIQLPTPNQTARTVELPSRDTLTRDYPFSTRDNLIPNQAIRVVVSLEQADDLFHVNRASVGGNGLPWAYHRELVPDT